MPLIHVALACHAASNKQTHSQHHTESIFKTISILRHSPSFIFSLSEQAWKVGLLNVVFFQDIAS